MTTPILLLTALLAPYALFRLLSWRAGHDLGMQRAAQTGIASAFAVGGVGFAFQANSMALFMPAWLPAADWLSYLAAAAQFALAVMLIRAQVPRWLSWAGLGVSLIVLPVNIYLAILRAPVASLPVNNALTGAVHAALWIVFEAALLLWIALFLLRGRSVRLIPSRNELMVAHAPQQRSALTSHLSGLIFLWFKRWLRRERERAQKVIKPILWPTQPHGGWDWFFARMQSAAAALITLAAGFYVWRMGSPVDWAQGASEVAGLALMLLGAVLFWRDCFAAWRATQQEHRLYLLPLTTILILMALAAAQTLFVWIRQIQNPRPVVHEWGYIQPLKAEQLERMVDPRNGSAAPAPAQQPKPTAPVTGDARDDGFHPPGFEKRKPKYLDVTPTPGSRTQGGKVIE